MKYKNKTGLYTISEISRTLGISIDTVKYRIKKMGLKPVEIVDNFYHYDYEAYANVCNFKSQIIEKYIVEVIHHSQTFHIYESKSNFIDVL